jgi:hypothetical protein
MKKANRITKTLIFECLVVFFLASPAISTAGVIITSEKQEGAIAVHPDIKKSVGNTAIRSDDQGDEISRKILFIESGVKPNKIGLTTSSGVNLPFSNAVKMIVPPGWKGYLLDDRISQIKDMTWFAKQVPWTDALAPLLVSHRLVATIDWSKKEIGFDISLAYK